MYVNEKLTAKCVLCCQCWSSGVNRVYYRLKSVIFVDVVDLLASGRRRTYSRKKQCFLKVCILAVKTTPSNDNFVRMGKFSNHRM